MKVRTLFSIALLLPFAVGCATTTPQSCSTQTFPGSAYTNTLADAGDPFANAPGLCNADDLAMASSSEAAKVCTFEKGLFAGEHGRYPAQACNFAAWDEYQDGYAMGRKIYETNNRLEVLSKALENSRNRLWKLESSTDGIGLKAEISRVKSTIDSLVQVRDVESRRLVGLRSDLTH